MSNQYLERLEPASHPLARELLPALIDYEEGWNAVDANRMFRSASADITQINIIGMLWQGKKAVVDAHSSLFGSVLKGVALRLVGFEHLRSLGGDAVSAVIRWDVGGFSLPGTVKPGADNLMTMVFQRDAGEWRLCHIANIEVVAALAAANPIPERQTSHSEPGDIPAKTEEKSSVQPCRRVAAGEQFTGRQGLDYAVGISAESVGARHLHLQLVTIPPGARAFAHRHVSHETAIYALAGVSGVWHGADLEHHDFLRPGEFFYIPANTPHLPYNPSATEPVVAVIARTDPNEQESVSLMPELDHVRLAAGDPPAVAADPRL